MRRSFVPLVLSLLLLLGSMDPALVMAEPGENSFLEVEHRSSEENSLSINPSELPDLFTEEENQTVTESTYFTNVAVNKVELVINAGESYRFTNNTSQLTSITTDAKTSNNIRMDYVTYNSEGKVTYSHLEYTGNPTVSSNGGVTVITADYGSPVSVSFNPSVSYSYSPAPALLKKTLHYGDSYLFSNQSLIARSIMSDAASGNGKRFDYAVYQSDGSLEKSNFETYTEPSISVGDTVVLTGASTNPVTVGVPYEGFTGYETDEPAYDSVLLQPGESREFTNIGSKSSRIEHSGTAKDKFDYVVYDAAGTEISRGTNTSLMPIVSSGRKVVVTLVTNNPLRVGAPYRSFMSGERNNEAISRVELSPGESYLFTNQGSLSNPVKNNARAVNGKYDYTVFKADGSYSSQGFDAISTPTIPAGGFAIITVQGNQAVTFDYTDDFTAVPSSEPSHYRVTLSQGESFEFTNINSSPRYLHSNASSDSRFDWVEYYPDGTEQAKRLNTYTDPQVSSGNSIVVTAASSIPVTFGANYRLFSWKDKDGPAISKIEVHQEQSYKILNKGTVSRTIISDGVKNSGKYDVAIYDEDGTVYRVGFSERDNLSIPAQGYAIVTGQSENAVTFSYTDSFVVEAAPHPALLRAKVLVGNTFTYTNVSGETERIFNDASSANGSFAYTVRRPNGTEYSSGSDVTSSVSVPAGYAVTVTPLTNTLNFGGVYTSFTGTTGKDPLDQQITLSKDESYVFTNQLTSSQILSNDASKETGSSFDYVIYDQSGNSEKAEMNGQGNISVSPGSQVVVTVTSEKPVTFIYGQAFKASSSLEPALLKRTLVMNQQGAFKNTSAFAAKLVTDASTSEKRYFDYSISNKDGSVVKKGEQATGSSDVPSEGIIRVKTTSINPVTFAAPYRMFEFVDVQDIVFEDLQHRQLRSVQKEQGQNGYYRFVAPETGRYRFVTKELPDYSLQPVLTLYDQPELLVSLGSSDAEENEFGVDYTVLELDLVGGATYYLKLSEKSGHSLNLTLIAAMMQIAPEAVFNYKLDGRLEQITFPSGDKLFYEYDPNGNLKRRTKKVYPFQ